MASAESSSSSTPPPFSASASSSASPALAQIQEGLLPSHGISLRLPLNANDGRPQPVSHLSMPSYQSPIRHHRRAASRTKDVKTTLDARSHYGSSDDDGSAIHRINQYVIKQEIGRGSFGAVHLAVDQYGDEYAVKEFSKSRLRKRAQSNLLRQGHQRRRTGHLGTGFNSPLHRTSTNDPASKTAESSSLDLIKEEIAIMKKLSHHNLVSLFEVLDDPEEDSLYMVLEMCKKGVVMKVGLDARAEPYEEEACRCWFRDMILGIEYLHAQGVVHRDIKPDNCLITDDDVLKIVDFGVSEMFEKQSDMATAKSAGSPAFMAPELCVAKHGSVSGRAADIWSMGATLYCLRYGHIPFEKDNMLELYESIRQDEIKLEDENNKDFADLMHRILHKDPEKRISMDELRAHPWVTKNDTDPLLPAEENCSSLVEPPTEQEKNHAITGNMGNLLVVMRAVRRFKRLLYKRRPHLMEGIFGRDSRLVTPPNTYGSISDLRHARSSDAHDRRPYEQAIAREGVHRDVPVTDNWEKLPLGIDKLATFVSTPPQTSPSGTPSRQPSADTTTERPDSNPGRHRSTPRAFTFPVEDHAKGHAHDPLLDTLYLSIGTSATMDLPPDTNRMIVSESPPAIELNIYEQAYQDELTRIQAQQGRSASMYLTRFVEHRDDLREMDGVLDRPRAAAQRAKEKMGGLIGSGAKSEGGGLGGAGGFAAMVKQAKERKNAEKDARDMSEREQEATSGAERGQEDAATEQTPSHGGEQAGRDPRLSTVLDLPGSHPRTPDTERAPPG